MWKLGVMSGIGARPVRLIASRIGIVIALTLGARVTTRSSLDLSFVRLQALPANLTRSLQLMADVVLNPVFPADLVALEKRRQISQQPSQTSSRDLALEA